MITRRDGTKKLPEGDWPNLPGDIWHGRSLVRVNDPSHDGTKVEEVWERFEREDWDGLWSEELIGEIRDHFSLDEPESQAQKDQLNRSLSRHHVLYPGFTLVVVVLGGNSPPVSHTNWRRDNLRTRVQEPDHVRGWCVRCDRTIGSA